MMKAIFREGVNIDYLVALKLNNDGYLEKIHYNITTHKHFKKELLGMLENDFYDIIDIYDRVKIHINTTHSYKLCIGHDYSDAYINTLEFPDFNRVEILQEVREQEKNIEDNANRYVNKWGRKKTEKEKDEIKTSYIEKHLSEFHRKLKEKWLARFVKYIEGKAYNTTYNEIKDNVQFLSVEKRGWTKVKGKSLPSWEYEVNEDLKVSLWSNFCYGSSSRFIIQVYYKGMRICPYSEFVTYRYANKTDIINYTRKYCLSRSSWDYAADFVMYFCNGAIADAEDFVSREVLSEVQHLVHELEDIFTSGKKYLEGKFEESDKEDSWQTRYSGVRNVTTYNSYELTRYNKNPQEYELLFKMQKITGALSFLESMENFVSICRPIRRAIVKIEDLNAAIYPELCDAIIPIESEVKELSDKVEEEEQHYKKIESKVEFHLKKMKVLRDREKDYYKKEREEEIYREKHPTLAELEKELYIAQKQLSAQRIILSGRKNYLTELKTCKKDIEKSGILEDAC